MTLPGFTAANSIGPTVQTYRAQRRDGPAAALHPQADAAMLDEEVGDDLADDGAEEMAAENGDDAETDDAAENGEEPEGEEDLDEAEEA